MRPVDRGEAPQIFEDYRDAKEPLVGRLGDYCSFCERPIKTNLAVEHVLPKSLHPDLQEEWTNFLLACVNCNSSKSNKPVDRGEILLPDQDNTLLAFRYTELGEVFASDDLDAGLKEKAESLLALTGLNRFPDEIDDELLAATALERWQQRSNAWKVAMESRALLLENDNLDFRKLIILLAVATGFFSVWMNVFIDDAQMRLDLVKTFPGTSPDCFDDFGQPLNRPGGHL